MLPTLIRRAAEPKKYLFNFAKNPYKARTSWPPDFDKLSHRHQFRLERRYRRRAKLKFTRPMWTKGIKLAQWGSILFVIGYGVLYMDGSELGIKKKPGEQEDIPFKGIRDAYKSLADSIWTHSTSHPPTPEEQRAISQSQRQIQR